jgi:hypothetical protein
MCIFTVRMNRKEPYRTRLWAMLLGLYVLLLTAVPCHCHDYVLHEAVAGCEMAASASAPDSNELEMCTPFCCCTAVHGASFFYVPALRHPVFANHEKPRTMYTARAGRAFHARLYRPPMV